MMRFHALQRMHKHASALEVMLLLLRDNAAFNFASRPECVSHGAPRVLWIRAKVALAILAHMEARTCSSYGQVHNAFLIDRRLDRV